jgi:hypothetical protein
MTHAKTISGLEHGNLVDYLPGLYQEVGKKPGKKEKDEKSGSRFQISTMPLQKDSNTWNKDRI